VSLKVDILDERTVSDQYGDQLQIDDWERFTQELSFQRNLIFMFNVDLALPKTVRNKKEPLLHCLKLTWPTTTSYHNLRLLIPPPSDERDWEKWEEKTLFYIPFEPGRVEWRGVRFSIDPKQEPKNTEINIWKTPPMLLIIEDPGEFYQQKVLPFSLEVTLPDALLSGGQPQLFDTLGQKMGDQNVKAHTKIQIEGSINLQQRFDRKILSPHQQLQFAGVMAEAIRIRDIEILLRDKGFRVSKAEENEIENQPVRPMYLLKASRKEGPDDITLRILVRGLLDQTQRETTIPGGQKYTTALEHGSMVIDMRAELRGDIKKLTQLMNEIHKELKERFHHVVTLE
jgi:hypothetical protein